MDVYIAIDRSVSIVVVYVFQAVVLYEVVSVYDNVLRQRYRSIRHYQTHSRQGVQRSPLPNRYHLCNDDWIGIRSTLIESKHRTFVLLYFTASIDYPRHDDVLHVFRYIDSVQKKSPTCSCIVNVGLHSTAYLSKFDETVR
jgi:hypothetical protein